MTDWTDRIVGARMATDRAFEERIEASEFTRQQWGLIMTATEFEIEHPEDPERARLVGNTESLPAVVPELERMANRGPMGAGGAGAGSSSGGGGGGGLFGSIKSALGLGGGGGDSFDEEKVRRADALVAEYAERLQAFLEDRGRWDEIREAASEGERGE
ncbi:DUF5799 family protein [Halomarina halobia]|uniref:DUF5799 family protein n=1 Tax=Halomarina halobia TaxID=3033386 RepID=A0ABD6A6C5_9EURY|nr:DUF5799 family protein [Halomarina sp. PSR21]